MATFQSERMAQRAKERLTPMFQRMRDFFLQRKYNNALRYEDLYSARTQPPPRLPEGVCHRLSNNYYLQRDARREVIPPVLIANHKLLAAKAGSQSSGDKASSTMPPSPGPVFAWDADAPYIKGYFYEPDNAGSKKSLS